MIISWISGIESALEGAWGCVQAFENESPSARLFIRYDLPASTATATPGTRGCHEPAQRRRRGDTPSSFSLPSPSPPFPSLPRRRLTATPKEALYLTANNRTIFHVTALARLVMSTRQSAPSPLPKRRQKGIEDGERLSWHSSFRARGRSKSHLMVCERKKTCDKCLSIFGWYPYIRS